MNILQLQYFIQISMYKYNNIKMWSEHFNILGVYTHTNKVNLEFVVCIVFLNFPLNECNFTALECTGFDQSDHTQL